MKTYNRILRAVFATPWAILPEKLDAILAFLELKAEGKGPGEEKLAELRASYEAAAQRAANLGGTTIAVLPIYGTISHRMNMFSEYSGGTSVEKLRASFRASLADPNVKSILLDVDSPGGSVDGITELADEIFQARGQKPITAVANTMMASAAYWLGSQADELIATPSAVVGSIGVYGAHEDDSALLEKEGVKVTLVSAGKFKTEGNPYEPLSDEGRQAMQSMVDEYYDRFTKAVARGRGVKASDVRDGFGEGRAVTSTQALKLGMVDRVATFDEALNRAGKRKPGAKAEEVPASIQAAADEVERKLVAASEPDSIARDLELRRRQLELASA